MRKDDVTIADVAKESGVSVSTVSRILNNKPDVSSATRERVLVVIEQLGYAPHAQAQALAAGESRTIALLDPVNQHGERVIDQLHLDFMIGAAAAAGENHYFFNIIATPITERNLLSFYRRAQFDGVILMEIYLDDWRVNLLRQRGLPFVMIGQCADNNGLSFVELDFDRVTQLAFQHLVSLGHRCIGFIGFPNPLRENGYGPAVRGWSGYQTALRNHGLRPYFRETNYTPAEMAAATRSLLAEEPALTALFALADAPIAGVLSTLRQAGRQVPQDFSVVGLAIDRIAELMTPRLTAVRFPSFEMGYQAATMLVKRLQNEAVGEEHNLLPPEFAVRDSSGAISQWAATATSI